MFGWSIPKNCEFPISIHSCVSKGHIISTLFVRLYTCRELDKQCGNVYYIYFAMNGVDNQLDDAFFFIQLPIIYRRHIVIDKPLKKALW